MNENPTHPEYAPALIRLLRGVVYADDESTWKLIRDHEHPVRAYFETIGLTLHWSEADGYAFLRQDERETNELPQLVRRVPLNYSTTLLCVLLRERLLQHDAGGVDFLTLPQVSSGVGIFGGGFQIELLREALWIRRCDVLYWGDIDAHGFMILSQLRSFHPGVRSVMMDVETFETFRSFATEGKPCHATALPHLTPEEHAVFESLARNNLLLEQERIPHAYAKERLGESLR